jgi:hypothetical protein
MADEEKKTEEKKPEKTSAPGAGKLKINYEELAARISFYIAIVVLILGILVRLEVINILGISAGKYMLMTIVWLLISIGIIAWNINKKIPPKT